MAKIKTLDNVLLLCSRSSMLRKQGRVFHAFHDCSALRRNPESAGRFHVSFEKRRYWYTEEEFGVVREKAGGPIVGSICKFCTARLSRGQTPSGENPFDIDGFLEFCKTLVPDEVVGLIETIKRETGVAYPPED
jgi:hypothetical protein